VLFRRSVEERGVRGRLGLAAIGILTVLSACAKPAAPPLEAVAPLPAPSAPAWIKQIAPLGKVTSSAQIRVIFANPVIPVEQLGSGSEKDLLAHFRVAPALAGSFVVLTPRMIGFESDSALPRATRVRVTVTAGLRDLSGHALDRDLAWTFETDPIVLKNADQSPDATPTPATVALRPVVNLSSNTQLDADSLSSAAVFHSSSGDTPAAAAESPNPDGGSWTYAISPQSDLQKATSYTLTVKPGVLPKSGNLPSARALSVALQTYSLLQFVSVRPTADPMTSTGNPRFDGGDPVLVFNNALDPKTYAQHISVQPSPRPVGEISSLSDDGTTVSINPYALAPKTNYTISADADLQDIYGQKLGQGARGQFAAGNLAPYFWAPTGFNMFVAGQDLQLQYSAVNLPGNRYRAAYHAIAPAELVYADESDTSKLLPDQTNWAAFTVGAPLNKQTAINVPIGGRLGSPLGMLAYGADPGIPNGSSFNGSVALTNLGVFAQWFPQSATIMVQRLSDGAPLPGASVSIYVMHVYDQAPREPNPQPCAEGTTGPGGVFALQGSDLARCYAGNRPADQAPELLTVARSGGDWSFVRTYAWSGAFTYTLGDLDSTWSNGQPISRGVMYSDRQMYQPGERGWLTAVCYLLQNGSLRADKNAQYSVVLTDPNGHKRTLPAQTTNRYASFSFPVTFSKTQPLGYYTITATGPSGVQITGNFRVAEFHPPNFSVDLNLDRQYAAAGEPMNAAGVAKYLFGAPMSGANATFHVTREQASFTPKGWDNFTFGRQWFWPEEQPDISGDVSQQSVTLDAAGKSSYAVPVPQDLPYAMTYRVDLEATDASHLTSSATQSFTAVPSSALIGLRSDFVGTVNAPVSVGVIVTDPSGKAQSGSRVHVELQKMQYSGVTQIVEGAESARNQVQYTTVAQADTTTATAAQTIALTAKDPGSYRIRANFSGASSDATATDAQVWISGPGQAVWGDQNPSQLQMKLDRQTYARGDTATVAVASPYSRADLYLSVVRDRVLYKTLIHINGSAPRVRIPIVPAMFPNAAVEGVLVRRGAPLSSHAVQKPDSLVRLGMVALQLDLRPRYLAVRIAPGQAKLQPGARQTVRLQLRDQNGKAAQGQFTVIVADDAILRLSGYRPPDLVQTVFQAQPISTRYADNRPQVTLTQPSDVAQKGWGYGGGFLAGAASTRVRTHFVQLAYFNASVQTDAGGNVDISFTVPDNLTTWRIMAVAMTADATPRFGNADTTFIATKPLVTDPLLPQFARSGDRFDGGLLLLNGTSGSLDARTQGTLTGALSFASAPSGSVQAQQSFAPGMNAWRFGMIAGPGDGGTVQFRTLAGGSDAFRVPFAIRNTDVTESVIDSGATATTQTQIPLQLGKPGTVKVEIAGSLIPQISVPAARALAGDQVMLLPAIADRLSIAASLLSMQPKFGPMPGGVDARTEAAADISQLTALQRIDGGFAFWPDDRSSDASGSADALAALGNARAAGVAVSGSMISRARGYVAGVLDDPARADKTCTTLACRTSLRLAALRALAAAGDRRTDFLQSIYLHRASLGLAEEAALGVYLQQTPGWRAQADTVAAELSQRIYLTGRYANVQPPGPWYGSLPQAQAAYLELLAARGAPAEDRDRALRALLAQSCRCGWPSLSDTAAALRAISAFASRESAANFTAELLVDGKTVGSGTFRGSSASKTIALPALSPGNHVLALRKSGSGTLHYVVSYSYQLGTDAPGRFNGLRVIRTVHPANQQAVLATVDIAAESDRLDLPAGNVYDIGVQIAVDHPVDRVVITDPLPAGFEALDTSFQTTAAYYQPLTQAWQIDYQQVYRDRVTAFAEHLDTGVYTLHYLVRSVTPGTYIWPGANAYLLDAPEQFGRSAFRSVKV
jgi:uncharacterized protein YfaS (alpha-2-macroglobulin family)